MLTPVLTPLLVALLATGFAGTESYLGPSLSLNFSENSYSMGSVGQQPVSYAATALITFTRSTAAWEWDWQGNYSEVAAGVMRIAHDPLTKSTSTTPQTLGTGSYTFATTYQYAIGAAVRVSADAANWMVGRVTSSSPTSVTIWVSAAPTGAGTYSAWTLIVRRGIRVEEQRTNLLTNSVLAGGTSGVVGSGAVAPTNWTFQAPTPSGEIALVATSLGTPGIRFQATAQRPSIGRGVSVLANTTYVHHARITALTGTLEAGNALWVVGQPVGTTLTYWRNGVPIPMAANVSAGDHIAVVVAVGATAGTFTARFGPGSQSAVTCDCTMTMPQVEQASAPSSYIPTGASQVIRAADVPNVNTLAPWFNASEGTLVVVASRSSTASWSAAASLAVGETTASELYIVPGNPGSGTAHGELSISGVTNGANVGPVLNGAPARMALSYRAGAASFSAGGLPPVGIPAPSIPAFTRLRIGTRAGGNFPLNGIIESITYHPRVIDVQQASA